MSPSLERQWFDYKRQQIWKIIGILDPNTQIKYLVHWVQQYERICGTCMITDDLIRQRPDLPWNFSYLSENPYLTWDVIQLFPSRRWNSFKLSQHRCITWEMVEQHPDFPWDYNGLSLNPNITWHIVTRHRRRPWNIEYLSQNPNITYRIVRQFPECPWSYSRLSRNPSITWDNVLSARSKSWDIQALSSNRTLTPAIVNQHPHYKWDYIALCCHPNFTWNDFLKVHPGGDISLTHFRWKYSHCNPNEQSVILGNPGITFQQLVENSDQNEYLPIFLRFRRLFDELIINPMTIERELFYKRFYLHQMTQVFNELNHFYFHPQRYMILLSHGHVDNKN